MNIRNHGLIVVAAALLLSAAGTSEASYTLTASAVTATPSASLGGTTFTFTPSAGGVQTGSTASNFNVIDVGVGSGTTPPSSDSGTITLSQTYTLTGNGFTETASLMGTLTLLAGSTGGVVSTFTGTVSVTGGSGFTVAYSGYAPPSPGSGGTGGATGNISIVVIPSASVPEPASIAMVGLGLVGIGGYGLRRRRASR